MKVKWVGLAMVLVYCVKRLTAEKTNAVCCVVITMTETVGVVRVRYSLS